MGDSSNMDLSGGSTDPSMFLNQSFPGIPDTGQLASDMGVSSFADLGNLSSLSSDYTGGGSGSGSATGSGFSLGGLLGGLGSTVGALLPALSAAGQIAAMALRPQQQIPLHFPSFPQAGFGHFGGLSPQGMTAAPKLAGEVVTQYDPLNSYAELVRSMR